MSRVGSREETTVADPRFSLSTADLAEADLAPLLDGVEIVFHQAAQAGVRASWGKSFEAYVRDNVLATQRLLEYTSKHYSGEYTSDVKELRRRLIQAGYLDPRAPARG